MLLILDNGELVGTSNWSVLILTGKGKFKFIGKGEFVVVELVSIFN